MTDDDGNDDNSTGEMKELCDLAHDDNDDLSKQQPSTVLYKKQFHGDLEVNKFYHNKQSYVNETATEPF